MNINDKKLYFAQYFGLLNCVSDSNNEYMDNDDLSIINDEHYLVLTALNEITDFDIKNICKFAHNLPDKLININSNFKIERHTDIIHCTYISQIAQYHICLNYKYATINCNLHIYNDDTFKDETFKSNIGEINFNANRVVGYIQCLDYLRFKGYAVPFMHYSIDNLIKLNVLKIK